jgi:hypothetical protein
MGLLDNKQKEGEDHAVFYMTRDMLDAGKQVINICDTDVDKVKHWKLAVSLD